MEIKQKKEYIAAERALHAKDGTRPNVFFSISLEDYDSLATLAIQRDSVIDNEAHEMMRLGIQTLREIRMGQKSYDKSE